MSNLKNLFENKKILITSLIAVSVITSAIFFAIPNKEKQKIKADQKKIEFVFNDDFFGKSKKEVVKQIELDNSILIAKHEEEPEPIIYHEEPEEEIIEQKRQAGNFLNSKAISYSTSDNNNLDFLSNKDNPSTIASREYDLSKVITTNKYIPVVLETAVNSEIPAPTVIARVESDVYGFHPKDVLIPNGSVVEGAFEKIENKHSRKMQISWFKITTPKGKIIILEASSSDSHGASGFQGHLDQRLKDRYGAALFFSGLNTLANLSVDIENTRQLAIVESITRELAPLTNQVIRENLNILPIIQIRKGQRFNIRPHQNILFKNISKTQTKAIFIK